MLSLLKQQKELQRSRMHCMPEHAEYARANSSMLRHTTAFARLEGFLSIFSSLKTEQLKSKKRSS
jgi:hypothetical protein